MALDFYYTKQNLIKLASKMFTYEPKKLTKDIDTEGDFDYIESDVHGVVSFSPAEQVELENLNYGRDEQGRDYFSTFLTIAIQAGVKLGYDQKQKEIDDLEEKLEKESKLLEMSWQENNKLRANQMPKDNDYAQEILNLKQKINDLHKNVNDAGRYRELVNSMLQGLQFDGKIKIIEK